MFKSFPHLFLMMAFSLPLTGCSGDHSNATAPVTGKLTWNGTPVTAGELLFAPQKSGANKPGKPGSAVIQSDGTFVVSTYGDADGAVVGNHTLTYFAPPPRPGKTSTSQSSGEPSREGPPIPSPFVGLVVEAPTVEIPESGMSLDVRLIKP